MEVGTSENKEFKNNIQEIKIEGSHAFIALLTSLIQEQSFMGTSDAFTLTILGMKTKLEKMGYNIENDWNPFVEGVIIPIINQFKNRDK